jgi:hypothetical protein
MVAMTSSEQGDGGLNLEALADEVVQLQTAGTAPDVYTRAELHDEAVQRLLRLHAVGGDRRVVDHVATMRRLLDIRRHPVPSVVAPAGSMSVWATAYLWASMLTTLAGYSAQAGAEGARRSTRARPRTRGRRFPGCCWPTRSPPPAAAPPSPRPR